MNDKRIVIDAGHGGDDPGAVGNGIIEKDLNLAISQYMFDRFKELGIPVKMTRTSDETVSPTQRVNRVLDAYGNDSDVIVISNHINAGGGNGAEVIYALRNNSTLADLVLDEIGKTGQATRETFQRRLPSNPSKDYYFMHRNTGITEPIIVEYGFLDTASDAARLKQNYEEYAEAVVKAVLDYLNLPYDKIPSDTNIYIVTQGDSLWSVAKKFNVSVEDLKNANNLSSNLLQVGQRLRIPTLEEKEEGEYIVYMVARGDSLYSIARKYNTTVQDLVSYNNLATTNLSIGQQLLIPREENVTTPLENTYTVKSGDNLYSIANRFNVSVSTLRAYNNLSSDLLQIGQILRIPTTTSSSENTVEYVVKSGDNLYTIANRYGTSVSAIRERNNLNSNLLQIGQILVIPTTTSNQTYTVKSGDSLYAIASRFNTTVDEIKRKNNLNSNLLQVGQILII